jgi:hypothetical protein
VPSHQREGKQNADPEEDKEDIMGFQKAKRDLKAIYGHSDSESSDNECRKMLYVMFKGSWDITPIASSRTCTESWWRPYLS